MSNESRVAIELVVDDKGTALIKRFASESEASFHKIELAGTKSASQTLIGWEKMGDKGAAATNRFAAESEKNFNKVGQVGSGSADLLSAGWMKLIGVISAYFSAQMAVDIITQADNYTLLNSRLQLVTSSSSELAMVQGKLREMSQETGTAYEINAGSFSKLGMALKSVGASSEELLAINEMVNKSLSVSGASTAEATSFQLQFAQAMGSGVLQGDEFRAMMESNSYFGAQLAKALGTNIAGLRQMSQEGKLTTDVLRAAFPKMASEIDTAFDKMTITAGKGLTMIKNSLGGTIDAINTTTGGTNILAQAFVNLADRIDELNKSKGFKDFLAELAAKMPDLSKDMDEVGTATGTVATQVGKFKDLQKTMLNFFETVRPGAAKFIEELNTSITNNFNPMNYVRNFNEITNYFVQTGNKLRNALDGTNNSFFIVPTKLAAELSKGLDTLAKKQGEYKKAIDATTSSQIKLSAEQTKEAEKIVAAEKKKADDIAAAQEEMYKETGAMADQHYAAEQEKLVRKAASWKEANGNIVDIENWLYDQLGVLEAEAEEKGEIASAAAMDRAQGNYRVLIDELEAAVQFGTDQTNMLQDQIKGLDGSSFTISANLDGSGFENTINVLIDKFRQLAETAAAVKAQAADISGSSALLPSTFGDINYSGFNDQDYLYDSASAGQTGRDSGGKSITGGKTSTSNTTININQKLSRSDVTSILSEQKRIEARK